MGERTVVKPNCDFGFPTHPIEGEVIEISMEEVRIYDKAYAHMYLDFFTVHRGIYVSNKEKVSLLAFALTMAHGGTAVIPEFAGTKHALIIDSGESPWVVCSEHKKVWEGYKQKHPAKGN